MSSVHDLEAALTKDFRRYHVAAQAQRLLGGSASTFLVELAAGGTHDWSVKAVVAAAVGAVWTTARLQWPSVPWGLVTSHLRAAKDAEPAVAGPDGASSTAATASTSSTSSTSSAAPAASTSLAAPTSSAVPTAATAPTTSTASITSAVPTAAAATNSSAAPDAPTTAGGGSAT